MGWYFSYCTREQLVKDIREGRDGHQKPLESAVRGTKVWCVYEQKEVGHLIVVYLTASDRQQGQAGYKEISEDMGPYESDCPTSWFEKYPTTYPASLEWRERARASQKRRQEITKRKVEPGVKFFHGPSKVEFTVVEPYHMRGWWVVRDLIGRLTRSRTGTIQRCMGGVN
jgi:hypothetical protein